VIERQFTLDATPALKVTIRSGHVRIEAAEQGAIRLMVDTKDPTFEVRQQGDVVHASGLRPGRADVTAYVPEGADLEISTASGDVEVNAHVGRLQVAGASGSVRFARVRHLRVKTASGNIEGTVVEGDAECITTSGDVDIAELADQAEISTASGDVSLSLCRGSLDCVTVSGDIRIGEATGPEVVVKSTSGDVRVGIPARTRLDLDARSLSGTIHLPTPGSGSEPPEREIRAVVRLVSGDLRIERST
jgi:DUF4097 and DUF4098 domain-containing protein YvlB